MIIRNNSHYFQIQREVFVLRYCTFLFFILTVKSLLLLFHFPFHIFPSSYLVVIRDLQFAHFPYPLIYDSIPISLPPRPLFICLSLGFSRPFFLPHYFWSFGPSILFNRFMIVSHTGSFAMNREHFHNFSMPHKLAINKLQASLINLLASSIFQ